MGFFKNICQGPARGGTRQSVLKEALPARKPEGFKTPLTMEQS